MKKFLVLLMVIAMTSFLFVGCLGDGVTPPVDDEDDDEDDGVALVKTDTPYITSIDNISILSSSTQYINATEDGALFLVDGIGVAGALIKLYIDDVYAGIGYTTTAGTFTDLGVTAITMAEGADKTVHVTATLPGLAESDASTVYTFTYDKTAPTIASVVGDSTNNYITVTFNEAVANATSITWRYESEAALTYVIAALTPAAITTPTTSTVRLTEETPLTVDGDLEVADYLRVHASLGTCADLAGNLFSVPGETTGSVITGE